MSGIERYESDKRPVEAGGGSPVTGAGATSSVIAPAIVRDPRLRRPRQRGLTLVELIVAFTVLLVLSCMAAPLARSKVRAERERALRVALEEIRYAIDRYHDYASQQAFGPVKLGSDGYPESLQILVDGVALANSPDGKKVRLLRRIPIDPFTGKAEWGVRSDQDDPKSMSWGGQNVFDVYSKTTEKGSDGTPYSEW